jgi:DNA-binding CsgD family transcriptional regulator
LQGTPEMSPDVANHQGTPAGAALLPIDAWHLLQRALRLSKRELQIVQCIFADEKREAIACRLAISPGTVNTYFQRLYAKLNVASRPQLIVRVMGVYLPLAAIELTPSQDPAGPPVSSDQTTDEDTT